MGKPELLIKVVMLGVVTSHLNAVAWGMPQFGAW